VLRRGVEQVLRKVAHGGVSSPSRSGSATYPVGR
jgi:hypothetical protein